jgi:hypothetical protein
VTPASGQHAPADTEGTRRIRFAAIAILIATGAAQCWRYRHVIYPDGSQYLDIARRLAEDGPVALLNGCWSPAYPTLVGMMLRALRPGPYWIFAVVQAVNFVLYVAAVFAFDFFVTRVLAARERLPADRGGAWMSGGAVLVCAYAAFAVTIEYLLNVRLASPDMLVAAVLFAVSGLLVKAWQGGTPAVWAAIGALLAVGYLAKTAMFIVALMYLATMLALVPRGARRGPLVAAAVFALVAAPWLVALSVRDGRPTYGDTGRLMYAWWVDQWPGGVLWVGEPPESGAPTHPVARLFRRPDVFAFDWPTRVTYAPFYDPTYWNEGISARIYAARQARALKRTLTESLDIVRGGYWALGPVLLAMALLARRWRPLAAHAWALRLVWVPALLSSAIYLIVHIEARFIAGQIQIGLTLLVALLGAAAKDRMRLERVATIGCVLAACVTAGPVAAGAVRHTVRDLYGGEAAEPVREWQIAQALHAAGVEPGARVGVIGNTMDIAWAQVAEIVIAAESPVSELSTYVVSPPAVRAAALRSFERARVRAIVARSNDPVFVADGFRRLDGTGYAVRLIAP